MKDPVEKGRIWGCGQRFPDQHWAAARLQSFCSNLPPGKGRGSKKDFRLSGAAREAFVLWGTLRNLLLVISVSSCYLYKVVTKLEFLFLLFVRSK